MFKSKASTALALVLLCLLPFCLFAQNNNPAAKSFVFNLKNSALTSAGVFEQDGTLIRTLWSGENYSAGEFTEYWDGLDDEGKKMPAGNYTIKVLTNNVKAEWEGVIGNTTKNQKGFFDVIFGAAFNSRFGYLAAGYEEQQPVAYKFPVGNSNNITAISGKAATSKFVAADELHVYWGASDGARHWVYATNVSDDKPFISPNSITVPVYNTPDCVGAINVYHNKTGNANEKAYITGLAVQKNGLYLFVSHGAIDQLDVVNKLTGALVQTIKIDNPGSLAFDESDNLWMISGSNTVAKYSVNNNGTLSSAKLKLANVTEPVAIAANNSTVLVSELSTQQVLSFNNQTGVPSKVLGTAGGYSASPEVTNFKFYWKDKRHAFYGTFLAFQKDGTFWVGDGGQTKQHYGNCRYMHYNANFTYIENIQYIPAFYSCVVDKNNPERVFANYLEFKTSYNKTAKDNWQLTHNWGYNVILSRDDLLTRLRGLNTLSNGRTYAGVGGGIMYMVELVPGSGLRYTNFQFSINSQLYPDGNLYMLNETQTGKTNSWYKQTLQGFDGANNLKYSAAAVVETTPVITNQDPAFTGNLSTLTSGEITNSNVFVSFDGNTPGENDKNGNFKSSDKNKFRSSGYHLGGVKNGKWLWRTAMITHPEYSGPYPADGSFDIGNGVNQYSGSKALVQDDIIVWGYHGEFWKGGQTNMWNMVKDNGLYIGQFGAYAQGQPIDGMAGNSFAASIVKVGGEYYLYHNDESYHAGLHRWKISGLNTIELQTAKILANVSLADEGTDLMEGLPFNEVLENNTYGWTRKPEKDNYTNQYNSYWFAKTSAQTTKKVGGRDVFAVFRSDNGEASINRDLGKNVGLTSWLIKGKISFNENNGNTLTDGVVFFDVLDNTGKIIVRIGDERRYVNENNITRRIWANNKLIVAEPEHDLLSIISNFQKLKIVENGGVVTITYGKYDPITALVFEPGANWQNPKSIRLFFYSKSSNYTRAICVSDMKFKPNTETVANTIEPDAQCPGTGKITWEYWKNVFGTSVSNIPTNRQPDGGDYRTSFSAPMYFTDLYGARMRGYVCVPKTGDYTFYIATDDDGELWLSSDENAANKQRIAYVAGYTNEFQYDKFASQKSKPIHLVAGRRYYIEALQKEAFGGDHLSVGWKLPDGTLEAPIPGSRLIPIDFVAADEQPVVSISSPFTNSVVNTNEINIQTNVTDASNVVTRVEFYVDNVKLGQTTSRPYSFTWKNIPNGTYSLVAKAIDKNGDVTTSTTVKVTVNVPVSTIGSCQGSGKIIWEYWRNVAGSNVSKIPVSKQPDGTLALTSFSAPLYFGDSYGSRIRGYVCVAKSGEYNFYISTDDDGELWLSTDAKPKNKTLIASVSGYADAGNYTKFASQKSKAIYLKAGEKYYIEALQKEKSGGDHLSVAWRLPDGTMEAPIPGASLVPYEEVAEEVKPSISISSPAKGSVFTTNALTITTSVTDPNNNVVKVEFFASDKKIGEAANKPYSCKWQDISNGDYALVAKAVDKNGNVTASEKVTIAVNVLTTVSQPCSGTGKITWDYWTNVSGTAVANIPVNKAPDGTVTLSSFATPLYFSEKYASRIRGYLCVPASGEYNFYISTDDDGELWLSSNTDPANKQMIAYVKGWTEPNQYTKFASQQSKPIYLRAGEKYYIEALQKEEAGGDHLQVAWKMPDGKMEAPIPGARLISFEQEIKPEIVFSAPIKNAVITTNQVKLETTITEPSASITKVEFYVGEAKLGETTNKPYSYTWQKIANGTYTITAKALDKNGTVVTSDKINVTVNVSSPCSGTGSIAWEFWLKAKGAKVSDIPVNKKADGEHTLTSFATPLYFTENYGSRIRGYICVPQTGNYNFYIATDDDGELWLSTNAEPKNKQLIASVSGWTEPGQYTKFASQKSKPVYLVAGEKYYIEALQKEEAGGDHLSVAWQMPDGTMQAPIPGARLIPYTDENSKEQKGRSNAQSNTVYDSKVKPVVADLSIKAYPNPFISVLKIECAIPEAGNYTVELFNAQGMLLKTIFTGNLKPGISRFSFDGTHYPNGIFVCRLRSGTKTITKQVSLLR